MPAYLLIPFYLTLVLAPLALSWITGGAPRPFRTELASGLGMAAFAIILAEFVLSGRFRMLSGRVGMDVTMRIHQLMARTALVFALVHPLLYRGTPSGGPRPWDPTRQLTLTTEFWPLSTGILAYVLLPALVALAVWRKRLDFSYETWRLMHGVGALIIALALLHHTHEAGRYAARPEVAWLWVVLTGLAVASLGWVYLGAPLIQRAHPWRVRAVNRLSADQWELVVAPDGHEGLRYRAGQFVWLNVGHGPASLHENPFSIASAPAAGPEVSFLIRERGDFTGTLDRIAPGTRAYLDGPFGNMAVDGRTEPGVVLIAGGVGLAPLVGILRQMRLTGDNRGVHLIYSNREAAQIAFREELGTAGVTHVLSEPPEGWTGETGVVNAALLGRVLTGDQVDGWLFLICGPPAMITGVEDALIARGVSADRILSERFDYD
ncbi:MAG: hypothetical protein CML66_03005 [Rhodobacteraceae bacterium]|nr:hypothetical protein [Paracoccaceae bacterium]